VSVSRQADSRDVSAELREVEPPSAAAFERSGAVHGGLQDEAAAIAQNLLDRRLPPPLIGLAD